MVGSPDTDPAAVAACPDVAPDDARTHRAADPSALAEAVVVRRLFHRIESTSRFRGTCLVHCRPFKLGRTTVLF